MQQLSLVQRAEQIIQKFNLQKLAKTSVLRMYRQAKISFKIPRYLYFAKMRKGDRLKEQ
jgi:hypothetical protein